jgi:hypothetical protein
MARTRSRFDREEAAPSSDVYTGLLAISLVAMIASCILLFLDYSQYGSSKAPAVPITTPQVKPISQGMLPPPPPLEDRPFTQAPVEAPGVVRLPDPAPAPTTIVPVGGNEPSIPAPVMPALGETPAPTPDAPTCPPK